MKKIFAAITFLPFAFVVCFGQSSFNGVTPGKSTRTEVERVLGQPAKQVSETLIEYSPQQVKPYHQAVCGKMKIYVQYRHPSATVERIEVLCESGKCLKILVQPFQAEANMFPTPEATTYAEKGTEKEKQVEYFGKPHWAVQTLLLKTGSVASCRLGFYSLELYEAAVPKNE